MINEHRQDPFQVTRVEDQHPIEALGTNGSHESFRDPVRLRCLNRRPHRPNASGLKHVIEAPREFAIAIPNQETDRLGARGERPRDPTCLLRHPRVVRMGCAAGELQTSRAYLDEEQHVQPS
jgi:hypothetical protein